MFDRLRLPSGIVTFLLTDIEGSTELWDRSPEKMADALERHDRLLEQVVTDAGGILLKHKGEGDSTVSVFGDPHAALSAAINAQRQLAAEPWPDDLDLRVRVAVHTGSAHERDGDYFGPTLNRAARLRGLSSGGQILLSAATAEAVRHHLPDDVALDDRGRYGLRGLSREEHVFAVVGPSGWSTLPLAKMPPASTWPMPPALSLAAGGFVGRASELARLRSAWREAVEGRRRVLLVSGEPGIGKTRLAAELARGVAGVDGIVLYGRCDEVPDTPYQPFAQALGNYVSVCPAGLLQRQAGRIGGDVVRLVPGMRDALAGVPPPTQGDPDIERHALFNAAVVLISAASEVAPVLLVLDDFHWAAAPTVLLLRWLLSTSRDQRVLTVVIYRDTDLGATHPLTSTLAELASYEWVERVAVRGLSLDAVTAYLEEERAAEDLGAHAADLAAPLHDRTGGNPFYLGQVLRQLVESGATTHADERGTAPALADADLPEGIREVVHRRLARLSSTTGTVLAVAAIIGSEFSAALVERVLGTDDDAVLDALDEAVSAGMVVEAGAGEFVFTHALTRQALLDQLTPTRRMRLHRRVGDALEGIAPLGEHAEALAHHFTESARDGRADAAARYALIAGRRALERLAYEEAIAHLDAGIAVLVFSPRPDPRRRVELQLALTDAHQRYSVGEQALWSGLEAAAGARALDDPVLFARAALITSFKFWLGQGDVISRLLREALVRLGDSDPIWRTRLLARLATDIAFSESDIGRARPLADEALAEARRLGDPETLAFALVAAASTLSGTPEVGRITSLLDELDAVLQCDGLEYSIHLGQLSLRASVELERGDVAAFRRRVGEMEVLATSIGWRDAGRLTRAQQVVIAYLAGDLPEAEARNAELLENFGDHPNALNAWAANTVIMARDRGRQRDVLPMVAAAVDNDATLPAWRAALALLCADEGDLAGARLHYAPLLADDLASLPDDQTWTAAVACLAEVAAVLDDEAGARTLARHLAPFGGLVLSQATSNFVTGVADRFLGMLAATQGNWDEAVTRFEAALRLDEKLESPTLLARTKLCYGRSLLRRGHDDHARVLLEDVVAIAEPLGLEGLSGPANALARKRDQ